MVARPREDYDYDKALRIYTDSLNSARIQKRQAEITIYRDEREIALLKEMKNIIEPYLNRAIKDTKINGFRIDRPGSTNFDVTLYAQVTEIHTRLVETDPNFVAGRSNIKVALAYTYVPQYQDKPAGDLKSKLESLPDAADFIGRLAEICSMPEEDRISQPSNTYAANNSKEAYA